jgi:hypothetical protein
MQIEEATAYLAAEYTYTPSWAGTNDVIEPVITITPPTGLFLRK